MSRRDARQQETEDFLDANPQLVRYTTHIEVVENETEHCADEFQMRNVISSPYDASFLAQASINGDPVNTFNAVVDNDDDITLVDFVGFPSGEMFADFAAAMPLDGSEIMTLDLPFEPFVQNVLSLTENGFGVAQIEGGPTKYYTILTDPIPMEPMGNDAALDGEETIFFGVRTPYLRSFDLNEDEEEGPPSMFEMGGKELGIDFEVVGGRGTVQLVLLGFEDNGSDPVMVEMVAGGRAPSSRVDAGRIEAEMPGDSAFGGAYIAVTGDLQIVLTGVDLSTNFNPILDIT
jgi:hypothetical protein